MLDEFAGPIASGARVVVIGGGEAAARCAEALRARGCGVTTVADPESAWPEASFDVALIGEFREDWEHPRLLLRRLRAALRADGRVLVSRSGAGAAAVRVAVYGESEGESVAPVLREVDLIQLARQALGELLARSGYRVIEGTFDDHWIEGVSAVNRESANGVTSKLEVAGSFADEPAARAGDEPVARAEAELRELREFARTVLDRQRRLHEELARLRAAVAQRDESLAKMRVQLDDAIGATALVAELRSRLESTELRLAETEAQIADSDARRARLAATVVELRERTS